MPRTYRYTASVEFGGDTPTAVFDDVTVSYAVFWGSPERGNFGPPEDYDPGSGDEVSDVHIVSIDGTPWEEYRLPVDWPEVRRMTADAICDEILDLFWDEMIQNAAEIEACDRDEAADRRWEERRAGW